MTTKPNLLLLMTDQQRADSLGCVSDWARTPNIDRLAAEGVLFPNAITNSPVCMPARLALALGDYPQNFGLWRNGRYTIPEDRRIWVNDVQDAGYHTALIGKHHWQGGVHYDHLREREPYLHRLGFDYVHEVLDARGSTNYDSYLTDLWREAGLYQATIDDTNYRWMTNGCAVSPTPLPLDLYYDVYVGQQAKAHIAGLPAEQPWMCKVSFPGPHEPWDTPEPYASQFDSADMPPPLPKTDLGDSPRSTLHDWLERTPWLSPEDIAKMRANYAAGVTLIDDQIGEILATVEARGETDNTVVVLISDHGEMNGDHGMVYKNNFLNAAVHIPMVIKAPDCASPGSVNQGIVELLDVGRTLLDYAGGELTSRHHGISIRSTLTGESEAVRQIGVSQFNGDTMLLTGQYKLVVNSDGQTSLLYDQKNDPAESTNLAGRENVAAIDARLRDILLRFMVQKRHIHTDGQTFADDPDSADDPAFDNE